MRRGVLCLDSFVQAPGYDALILHSTDFKVRFMPKVGKVLCSR